MNVSRNIDVNDFVNSLKLADPIMPKMGLRESERQIIADPNAQAFQVGSSVHTFTDEVPPLSKSDVLNSCLFASSGATFQAQQNGYTIFSNPQAYYGNFLQIFTTLGWSIPDLNFNPVPLQNFGPSTPVSDIMLANASNMSPDQKNITNQAIDAMSKKPTNPNAQANMPAHVNWNTNANSNPGSPANNTNGVCHLYPASQNQNIIELGLSIYVVTGFQIDPDFLWRPLSNSNINNMMACNQNATLDQNNYAPIRDTVNSKLGDKVNAINNIQIG